MDISGVVAELTARIDGVRVVTGTGAHEITRRLWNQAIRHRPAIVVCAASADDVSVAVAVARTHDLPLSVLGGGHDWAGRGVRDGGLVIDLGGLRRVRIDPDQRIASLGGGATAGDLIAATSPSGLVATTGTFSTVGETGLALGGGYGPLCGVHGLAADNLLGADVVLADGSQVRADRDHEPDLYWALRGGGGNFGVVTRLDLRIHPLPSILAGFLMYPWSQARSVWSRVDDLLAEAPDQLTLQAGMFTGPEGEPVALLAPSWAGDLDAGERWIDRLRALGTPSLDQVGPMPYGQMLSMYDSLSVEGNHYTIRTRTVGGYSPATIDALIHAGDTRTSPYSGVSVHHFHGAATRIAATQTAFAVRDPHLVMEIVAGWSPDDPPGRHLRWAETISAELAATARPGGYVNLLGPEARDQIADAYGVNTSRLLELKRRYDPDGVFAATALPNR